MGVGRMTEFDSEWSTVPAAGTRVIVTGAAGGLGRQLTAALVKLGAEVVGIDLPGASVPGSTRLIGANLTDDAARPAAVAEAVELLGGLDAVVGAAGVVDSVHRADRFPIETFRADLESNLLAQFG